MEKINAYLFPVKEVEGAGEKFSEINYKFLEDYDRNNPALHEKAMQRLSSLNSEGNLQKDQNSSNDQQILSTSNGHSKEIELAGLNSESSN
mmetsp:Transcript_24485/g.21666  ORF Transcript_24485/g.21666 Transcript_24485/m.21666 type:complete len:91 (-) Transcript_24485:62-334(-)